MKGEDKRWKILKKKEERVKEKERMEGKSVK
jgi:hypothetical protein